MIKFDLRFDANILSLVLISGNFVRMSTHDLTASINASSCVDSCTRNLRLTRLALARKEAAIELIGFEGQADDHEGAQGA